MRNALITLALAGSVSGPLAGCGTAAHRPAGLVAIGAGLRGVRGATASVYAAGVPDVAGLTLDAVGRLWAAAAGLNAHSHDGVYVIAHPGARPRRVISGLDDPIGLLWLGRELLVSSVGRVSAYSGFDGTRFRRVRTIIRGPVLHGENNAMALSPDGRIVIGVTATCDHCAPRSKWSGSVVSFRPDGSDLRLYASRIRAPVGLAFYPDTSDLLASLNQRNDLGARTTGDALAFVPAGSDWRFPECYQQGGQACAGVPAPLAVLDQHAAVGSVLLVRGRLAGGADLAAVVAEWQTAKLARVALSLQGRRVVGGSPAVWLSGVKNPLALAAGAGGSALVGDWGSGKIYEIAPR